MHWEQEEEALSEGGGLPTPPKLHHVAIVCSTFQLARELGKPLFLLKDRLDLPTG